MCRARFIKAAFNPDIIHLSMIAGILLAGGKGTRIKSKDQNKVTLPFLNKPLIIYGVELLMGIASPIVVVVGAFYQSVKQVLENYPVRYAHQEEQLGTGHALKVGLTALENNSGIDLVLVGYGDHTMFYKKETVEKLVDISRKEKAAVSLITALYDNPDELAWGRIIRNSAGAISAIVEQKDATAEQRKVKEVNAGFYCFDYQFVKKHINKIEKSSVSGEYYITDLVEIALQKNQKVVGLTVPFEGVGLGINRYDELGESQKLYMKRRKSNSSITINPSSLTAR